MTDRIDRENWPTPRGPWHEVLDLSRLYDHGRPWCANAAGHPGEDGYPDPELHRPWHECRSPEAALDGALLGTDGVPADLTVYLAAPFRFGELRRSAAHTRHALRSTPGSRLLATRRESASASPRRCASPAC